MTAATKVAFVRGTADVARESRSRRAKPFLSWKDGSALPSKPQVGSDCTSSRREKTSVRLCEEATLAFTTVTHSLVLSHEYARIHTQPGPSLLSDQDVNLQPLSGVNPMGSSQSVEVPGGGTEGYHVLRVQVSADGGIGDRVRRNYL